MDPATIAFIGDLIKNSITAGGILLNGKFDRDSAKEQHRLNRETASENVRAQLKLQREQFERSYKQQDDLAKYHRETAFQVQGREHLKQDWPLQNSPFVILDHYRRYANNNRQLPLSVVVSPPTIGYDPHAKSSGDFPSVEHELSSEIRAFIAELEKSGRHVHSIEGWDTKRRSGQAAALNLFSVLENIPVLMLDTELSHSTLTLRAYTWGLTEGDTRPVAHEIISKLPYRRLLDDFARRDALAWEPVRTRYQTVGRNPQDIASVGNLNEENFQILELERQDRELEIDYPRTFRIGPTHYAELAKVLAYCHNIAIGMVSDTYSLMSLDAKILGLGLLTNGTFRPQTLGPPAPLLNQLLSVYATTFRCLSGPVVVVLPDLFLDLAEQAIFEGLPPMASQLAADACAAWSKREGTNTGNDPVKTAAAAIAKLDYSFVKRLETTYGSAGNREIQKPITDMLRRERPYL
ncbi:MAG: hypothetical protein NTX13_04440 [Acidobacteria bacterium]|nr:hypothetical protein [Acidobacteriota bacterium]